jgi:hypothetical protein
MFDGYLTLMCVYGWLFVQLCDCPYALVVARHKQTCLPLCYMFTVVLYGPV